MLVSLPTTEVSIEVFEMGYPSGPAILFLHGNSLAADVFAQQLHAPELQQFRLVAFSLPGHGQSLAAPSRYDLPSLRAVVREAVQVLDLEQALVVAHSLAGLLLFGLLPELPGLRGLLAVGAPPVTTAADVQAAFRFDETVMLYYTPTVTDEQATRMAYYALGPGALPDQAASVAAAIQRTDGRFRAELGASLSAGELADEVGNVAQTAVPLAFMAGSDDRALHLGYFDTLLAPSRWGEPVHLVPGTGHVPFLESPQVFNHLLLGFAAALAPAPMLQQQAL